MGVSCTFANLVDQHIHIYLKLDISTVGILLAASVLASLHWFCFQFLIHWRETDHNEDPHHWLWFKANFSFSAGLLWELRPLLHCPEPAAPSHRGPLHPPAAAGLAHPHRHEDGAAHVHEQVRLRRPQVFWPLTLHSDPTRLSVAKKRNISSRLIPPLPSPHLVDCHVFAAFVNEVLEDLTVK